MSCAKSCPPIGAASKFKVYLQYVQIPHSHGEGYRFSDTDEDYLVGALARLNLNRDVLHPRTRADAGFYLSAFPSNNIYHNNLAQAIEVLQCVDDALDILRTIRIADEEPIRRPAQAGTGMGVIEAPRGLLYHMARVDEEGVVEDHDVIVPTAQNQINIENDLRDHFLSALSGDEQRPERQPAGTLVLVRKGTRRSTLALSEGFSYLTLHLRRGLLQIEPKAP